MERKHDWRRCNCHSIFRCNVCLKFAIVNIVDEVTTSEEILQQESDIANRTDCSGEKYK